MRYLQPAPKRVTSTIMVNDLSPQTHLEMDQIFTKSMSPAGFTVESHSANLLSMVIISSAGKYAGIWPINDKMSTFEECENLLRSRPDIRSLLQTAHAERKYAKIRSLRMSLGGHLSKSSLTPH